MYHVSADSFRVPHQLSMKNVRSTQAPAPHPLLQQAPPFFRRFFQGHGLARFDDKPRRCLGDKTGPILKRFVVLF